MPPQCFAPSEEEKPYVGNRPAGKLARINTVMQRYIDEKKPAGISATIARHGKTVYLDKFCLANLESRQPMQLDTIFRILSMTKPITSVAMMMLYEEGWFNLNTPIAEFIPAFKETKVFVPQAGAGSALAPLERDITFRHLFTHTSGITYGNKAGDPVDQLYEAAFGRMRRAGVALTNASLLDYLPQLPLAFQPGTHWRYGLSIDVLGRLIEIISGKTLDVFFKDRICEPLGMVDTGFWTAKENAPRLACVYAYPGSEQTLRRVELPSALKPPDFLSGGGGLLSTLSDYTRFAQILANGGELNGVRLLSPRTVAMMEINQAPLEALPYTITPGSLNHAGYGYSLGMRVLMDVAASGQAAWASSAGTAPTRPTSGSTAKKRSTGCSCYSRGRVPIPSNSSSRR